MSVRATIIGDTVGTGTASIGTIVSGCAVVGTTAVFAPGATGNCITFADRLQGVLRMRCSGDDGLH